MDREGKDNSRHMYKIQQKGVVFQSLQIASLCNFLKDEIIGGRAGCKLNQGEMESGVKTFVLLVQQQGIELLH